VETVYFYNLINYLWVFSIAEVKEITIAGRGFVIAVRKLFQAVWYGVKNNYRNPGVSFADPVL
jgi:hypothetical protein